MPVDHRISKATVGITLAEILTIEHILASPVNVVPNLVPCSNIGLLVCLLLPVVSVIRLRSFVRVFLGNQRAPVHSNHLQEPLAVLTRLMMHFQMAQPYFLKSEGTIAVGRVQGQIKLK